MQRFHICPQPHICTAPSVINSLHQRLYCVPLMDLYWHIVITRVHGLRAVQHVLWV